MIKTLLVYDGKMSSAERIAERLSYLIGNAKVCELSEAPADLTVYEGYCLVFNFYGAVTAARETEFLRIHKDTMRDRRIAMVGIGFSDLGFMNYIVNLEKATQIRGIEGYFLTRESETDRIGGEIGKLMRMPEHPMEKEKLSAEIDTFIEAHNTLALATSTEDYLRNTPLEYLYRDGLFYIITEGGNKFRGILANGRFCAVIFDSYTGMGSTKGLQITGEAQIVPVGSREYYDTMAVRKITPEQLEQLPITMFLIKLVPMKYEMLNSEFKKDGYDVHQSMRTSFQEKHWEAGAIFAQASAAGKADQHNAGNTKPAGSREKDTDSVRTANASASAEADAEKTDALKTPVSDKKVSEAPLPSAEPDSRQQESDGDGKMQTAQTAEKTETEEEPLDADQAERAAMVSSILKSEGRDGSAYLDDTEEEQNETAADGHAKKSAVGKSSIAKTVGDAIREEFRKRKKKHEPEEEDISEEGGVTEYYDDDDDDDDFEDFDFDDDDFDEDEVFDSSKG